MVTVQVKVPPAVTDPPDDGHWTAMLTLPPLDVLVEVVDVPERELLVSVDDVDRLDWVVDCVVPLPVFALKPEAKK